LHIEADHTRAAMGHHEFSGSLGKGNIIGFFDDTTTDATTQARALLLAFAIATPATKLTRRWWKLWAPTCG
jgi:hypothetical protein